MEYIDSHTSVSIRRQGSSFTRRCLVNRAGARAASARLVGRRVGRRARLVAGACVRDDGGDVSRDALHDHSYAPRDAGRSRQEERRASVFHASANALGPKSCRLSPSNENLFHQKCDRTIRSAVSRSFGTLVLGRNLPVTLSLSPSVFVLLSRRRRQEASSKFRASRRIRVDGENDIFVRNPR